MENLKSFQCKCLIPVDILQQIDPLYQLVKAVVKKLKLSLTMLDNGPPAFTMYNLCS